jgi:hypothetical protein
MATVGQPLDLSNSTPAAPAGAVNITFQAQTPTAPPTTTVRETSGYVTFAFDIAIYMPVIQSIASQEIFRFNVRHTLNFPANFSGTVGGISCISAGSGKTAATASTTFIVNRITSGVTTQIGTIVFAAAGTVPTFTTPSGATETLNVADILTVVGPATADVTLANWAVTLCSTRTS